MSQSGMARVATSVLPPSVPLQFTGDNGTIAVPAGNNITIYSSTVTQGAGSTVQFFNSGSTSQLKLSDAVSNTILGSGAGNASLTGTNNVSVGSGTLAVLTSGQFNVGFGFESLFGLTTGSFNTGVGYESLFSLKTGNHNIAIGDGAASNYTTSESENIIIGETGTVGESGTIRIGTQGALFQNRCFIAGITGVSVSNPLLTVINSSTTQLGVINSGNNGVLITSPTGTPSWLANGSTGQVLTATAGSPPSWAAASAGVVVSITGGPGITITGTAANPIVNSVVFTDTTATTLAVDQGYFATAAGTYNMPATAAQGEEIIVVCDTAGAVVLDCPALNFIRIGNLITSSGGTATSTAIGDSLTLRYRLSSLTWYAVGIQGNWTLA